jgi:hypothetical protein
MGTARRALHLVNKAITDNKDVLTPPFLYPRISRRINIVLTAGYENNNLDCEAYLQIICQALSPIGIASASIDERWTKFLLYGVSLYLSMEEVCKEADIQ